MQVEFGGDFFSAGISSKQKLRRFLFYLVQRKALL